MLKIIHWIKPSKKIEYFPLGRGMKAESGTDRSTKKFWGWMTRRFVVLSDVLEWISSWTPLEAEERRSRRGFSVSIQVFTKSVAGGTLQQCKPTDIWGINCKCNPHLWLVDVHLQYKFYITITYFILTFTHFLLINTGLPACNITYEHLAPGEWIEISQET